MFTEEELENLGRLLGSADSANIELALELLYQNTQYLKTLHIPVLLFKELGRLDDYSNEIYHKSRLDQLWQEHFSKTETDALGHEIRVLTAMFNQRQLPEYEFMEALGDFEKAAYKYEPFIRINRGYLLLYKNIAKTLRRNYGRHEKAYTYYLYVLENLPDALDVKLEFADFLLNDCFPKRFLVDVELNRFEAIIKEALHVYPSMKSNYLHILATVADVYRNEKEKAVTMYREVLQLKADSAPTLNNLANLLFKFKNEHAEARRLATLAVKLMPRNIHYLDTLAWIEFKGFNNLDGAEELFLEIRKIDTKETHHASMTALGEVLELKGDFAAAEKYYRKALKLKPDSVYKNIRLADMLYFKLNKKEDALKLYRNVLILDPENIEAKRILANHQ